jgi:putative tryptophan/tyrosine transport system substrate-binding protein
LRQKRRPRPFHFESGGDPIKLVLVASFNRPGGNVTGAASLGAVVIAAKGLELLHELIPAARILGLLVNPTNPLIAETQERELSSTAHALRLEIYILKASTERDFDGVFAKLSAFSRRAVSKPRRRFDFADRS